MSVRESNVAGPDCCVWGYVVAYRLLAVVEFPVYVWDVGLVIIAPEP